jgi:cobalamin biosynthesis protein CobD/CbiB
MEHTLSFPSMIITDYGWVLAALALILMAARAYLPVGQGIVLLPLWWRFVLMSFAPALRRLDRVGRSSSDLTLRAVVIVVLAASLVVVVGHGLTRLDQIFRLQGVPQFLALLTTMQIGAGWRVARALSGAKNSDAAKTNAAAALASTYHLAPMTDGPSVRRLMIAHLGFAFDRMMILPIIWYLLFGITGALLASSMAALLWQMRLTPPHSTFGITLLALEKLLGAVPNWIAGVMLALAAIASPKAGIFRSLSVLIPDKNLVPYLSGGFVTATLAWGLKITLQGPMAMRDGTLLTWSWHGPKDSTAQVESTHLRLALYWIMVATMIWLGALLAAFLWTRVIA